MRCNAPFGERLHQKIYRGVEPWIASPIFVAHAGNSDPVGRLDRDESRIMTRRRAGRSISSKIGWAIVLAVVAGGGWLGWRWLQDNPQHNPYAPLSLDHPLGWATDRKLAELAGDGTACRALLRADAIVFAPLPRVGSDRCVAGHRTRLADNVVPGLVLRPQGVAPSCAVDAALILWMRERVQPAAQRRFGQPVARLEHLGRRNRDDQAERGHDQRFADRASHR